MYLVVNLIYIVYLTRLSALIVGEQEILVIRWAAIWVSIYASSGACTLGLLGVRYLEAVNISAEAGRNTEHIWMLSKHLYIILGNLTGLKVKLKVTKCTGTLKTLLLSVSTAVLPSWLLGDKILGRMSSADRRQRKPGDVWRT